MRRVVVTGMGALSPVGLDVETNWASLLCSRSGVRRIKSFDVTGYASQIAGEVDFSPEKHLPVKDLKKMDRFIQLAMVAGEEAIKNSGIDLTLVDLERFGANIGVGIGGLPEIQATYKDLLEKGPRRVSPFFIPAVITNLAAGQLSLKYGLKGPNICHTSACSSSAHSIGESMRMIQYGDVDMMLAGGAEAAICELGVGGFCAMRALSQRNDAPEAASRPWDRDRDGFVIGEGAAVLVLEELEHAKKRGATIIAEVLGYGANADAFHMTAPAPGGEGGARCMRLALKSGKVNFDQVDYINAHGTSTPMGDGLETQAMKAVFGDHAKKLAVSSTKSMTGHLLGAAGALEAVYTCLALTHQVAPPTKNLDNPSDDCDLNYVPHEPQQHRIRYAMSNSFGFGGTNASLLLGTFER